MAFQPVLDTAEIDMIYTLNGVAVQNVFYARLTGGYTLTDLQALADMIDSAFLTTFFTEMPMEVSYLRTEVRGLAVENDLVASQNAGAGTGAHAGAALPNQVTLSIKKTSGLTGRSARGRTYWIGIPETVLLAGDENFVSVLWSDAAVADIDFIRILIATVGLWEPVLVSRFANGVKRTEGKLFPWTGTINVDTRVDTNRGRLPKV